MLAPVVMLCLSLTIHDGDSLRCNGVPIRIAAIDAPEMIGSPACSARKRRWHDCDFAAGERARLGMVSLVGSQQVRCVPETLDRYDRTVARCSAGGVDLGCAMIAHGWAIERYGHADCRWRRR